MIKISVSYSLKTREGEFASCSVNDMEFAVANLDDEAAFVAAVRRAYELCATAVETQLGMDSDAVPAARPPAPRPPAPVPAVSPPPARNAKGNGRDYGPPKTARTFLAWLGHQHADVANRAAELAMEWKRPWKFLEWTDADIQHLHKALTEPAANGVH